MSIFTATLATAFSAEHLDPDNIVGLTVSLLGIHIVNIHGVDDHLWKYNTLLWPVPGTKSRKHKMSPPPKLLPMCHKVHTIYRDLK